MSLLTGRDLEFLSSLQKNWKRYYLKEIARLLKEDETYATTNQMPIPQACNPDLGTVAFRAVRADSAEKPNIP
jgi:hypothetical protein